MIDFVYSPVALPVTHSTFNLPRQNTSDCVTRAPAPVHHSRWMKISSALALVMLMTLLKDAFLLRVCQKGPKAHVKSISLEELSSAIPMPNRSWLGKHQRKRQHGQNFDAARFLTDHVGTLSDPLKW